MVYTQSEQAELDDAAEGFYSRFAMEILLPDEYSKHYPGLSAGRGAGAGRLSAGRGAGAGRASPAKNASDSKDEDEHHKF